MFRAKARSHDLQLSHHCCYKLVQGHTRMFRRRHVHQTITNCMCLCVCAHHATAIKEAQWQAREERARQHYEKLLEERKRKLEEQRIKEEKRRAAVEEKRRQKQEDDRVQRRRQHTKNVKPVPFTPRVNTQELSGFNSTQTKKA